MKNPILYTLSIITVITIAVTAILVGCDGDFGERSEKMDDFLDKFHNKKKVKQFSLKYDMNGATCEAPKTDQPQYDSGYSVILKYPCSMTNGKFNFVRWNSERDGNGKYSGDPDKTFPLIENVVLYALWDTAHAYDVTITSSIAGMNIPGSSRYSVGATVRIDAGTPPAGLTFQNWTTASKGVSFDDANSAKTTFTMPNNNVTVIAMFVANGGTLGWFTDNRNGGKTYRIVTILQQTWLAQNLDYLNEMTETDSSWCYDNDPDNCNIYGRLYNWDAAMKVCPAGWRLPDTADWNRLVNAAGGASVAGKRLKSTNGWVGDGNGTDEYGFSALPGGVSGGGGNGGSAGSGGYWWTATVVGSGVYVKHIFFGADGVSDMGYGTASVYFSVRCIKTD